MPLFNQGLFPIHDDTQVARVYEMKKSLADGHFPVRLVSDLGYGMGYPLFNFYAPLPYYIGAFSDFVLDNLVLSTKFMYGLGILISGIAMFVLMKEFVSYQLAILSSTLYTFAPYHAVQIYVRGSVGEYWSYGLLPLVLLGMYKTYTGKKVTWVFLLGIFISLLILSHNITSMLFVSIFLIYILSGLIYYVFKNSRNNIKIHLRLIFSLIIGVCLSSFFWIPAIFESSFTNVTSITEGGSQYFDHFVYLEQLWDSPWGFAGSTLGNIDGMSFKLGKIQIIFGVLGILIYLIFRRYYKLKNQNNVINFVALFSIISFFMILPYSRIVWDLLSSGLKYVQFPWRFNLFLTFGLCFFAPFLFKLNLLKRVSLSISIIAIILAVFINIKYFKPQYFTNLTSDDYKNKSYLNWTVSKISDEYLPKDIIIPKTINQLKNELLLENKNEYSVLDQKTNMYRFIINSPSDQVILLNKSFSPGWRAFLNGEKTSLTSDNGLISLKVNKGLNIIVLLLVDTLFQRIGNIISFLSFIFLFVLLINDKIRTKLKVYFDYE